MKLVTLLVLAALTLTTSGCAESEQHKAQQQSYDLCMTSARIWSDGTLAQVKRGTSTMSADDVLNETVKLIDDCEKIKPQ
ncbi:hypothetical protein [Glaciibacter flavus]|uniref:hypothetical protein n=1 Tax=Orlajensenia flava TaxID=2565934 RepID=UPI003B0045E4